MEPIKYFNSFTDKYGFVHSIDMVYCEYFSRVSIQGVLDILRDIHMRFPEIKYQEYERQPCSKYDWAVHNVVVGSAHVDVGKYTNYDKLTKTFDVLNMFQLRANPNKLMSEPWFVALKSALLSVGSSGTLRKFDYAIDCRVSPKNVQVVGTRKEPGLFKGTRYLGQAGRHGYVKVYDKSKEFQEKLNIDLGYPLTRVEYTFLTSQKPNFDDIAVFDSNRLNTDYSILTDTDRAIIDMYLLLKAHKVDYQLSLGRKKMDKLKEYILGEYVPLEFECLDSLIAVIKSVFDVSEILAQDDDLMQIDDDIEIPFY